MSEFANRPLTINAAFLQELKEVNQELWQLIESLRTLCGEPMSMRQHSRTLVDLLSRLRDQLAMHFSLEEAYGYFHNPVEVEAALAETARRLRAEHSPLYLRCSQLADHAENLWRERDEAALTTVLPVGVDEFLVELKRHENGESELIYRQLYESIGVAD
ncbi:MAG: hemerythrin domain-containing protein [Planctomycetales bacterium]|nr:hemerythrin domain-containing protein [Planctomycetales bacterium]